MNPLEQLKRKLMIKPTVQDRERVAVIIKGENEKGKHIVEEKEKLRSIIGRRRGRFKRANIGNPKSARYFTG